MSRARLVVIISGAGSNMLAIDDACRRGSVQADVVCVISNRSDAAGLTKAAERGIPTMLITPISGESRESFDARLAAAIHVAKPDWIVLAGYMRILSAGFVQAFTGRLLNIHPSLLPAHKGLHTHRRVIESHDTEHGATVHFVTAELDGGPRLLRGVLSVHADDTEDTLHRRVQRIEHTIYPEVLALLAQGRLQQTDTGAELDGQPLVEPLERRFDD
ncbi:MAG: phosphoribosylglycinamide formyltransferase [Steroidobacteraceae bacterium]